MHGLMGKFLRIKVRLNITNPLMRGFTLDDEEEDMSRETRVGKKYKGEEEDDKWCPFEYEFLPEFCYVCGIIGHDDKACKIQLQKGEKAQFGPWLRAFIERRKRSAEEGGKWSVSVSNSGGRSGGQWSKLIYGSDGPSWHKNNTLEMDGSSPVISDHEKRVSGLPRQLMFGNQQNNEKREITRDKEAIAAEKAGLEGGGNHLMQSVAASGSANDGVVKEHMQIEKIKKGDWCSHRGLA